MDKAAIYIHIPFCLSKCRYCDFCSYVGVDIAVQSAYIDRVIAEFKGRTSEIAGKVIDTIFIGGGTPSTLVDGEIARLIRAIGSVYDISQCCEITIEANPNTITAAKIGEYIASGITRVSIGVQSFNDKTLASIGRSHTSEQAISAVNIATASGLNVNVDIMIGLPNETITEVASDIDIAISLGVGHISCYSLILEENTVLHRLVSSGEMTLTDEDSVADCYEYAANKLQKSGYSRYEISNFGKPCKHNIAYWQLQDYIGLGVAAHSLTCGKRSYNTDNIAEYMASSGCVTDEVMSPCSYLTELIMLGLRMDSGIDRLLIGKYLTGDKNVGFYEIIGKYSQYLNITDSAIMLKAPYVYCMNSIIAEIIGEVEELWI